MLPALLDVGRGELYVVGVAKYRNTVTREFYEKLLIAFREAPGNASHAARKVCCDVRMARRIYDEGDKRYEFARPIKAVLESEKRDAIVQLRSAKQRQEDAAEAQRESARQESIEAHKQEQQMLKAARGDVLAVLAMAMELIPVMRELAGVLKEAVAKDPVTGKRSKEISAHVAMSLMTRHAQIVQKGVGAAEAVIQLSRLDRGATTVNVGVGAPDEALSLEDALTELEAISTVVAGAKRAGLLAAARAGTAAAADQ